MVFKMENPLVTIIIPVYNGEDYLADAIESALNQTYRPIEVLVISDGSVDGSDRIAESYGERIRYLRKENGGVSSVLNMAVREMKGEWLSWLSHDDIYARDKVKIQMERLFELREKGKDISKVVLCCGNDRIDAAGKHVRRKVKTGRQGTTPLQTLLYQMGKYTIGGCNVIAHRSAYEAMGGFNESNRTCSDAEMWYRLMLAGYNFLFMKEVLVHSRQHGKMVSATKAELCQQELEELHLKMVPEIVKRLPGDREICRLGKSLDRRSLRLSAELVYSFIRNDSFRLRLIRKINRIQNAVYSAGYRFARCLYRAIVLR